MDIMKRVKAVMHSKGISRAELVKLSGLKKTTVYRLFEDGIDDSKIRIETLAPIAKALDVDLDYLLGKEDAEIPPSLLAAAKKVYEQTKDIKFQLETTTKIIEKIATLTNDQIYQLNLYIKMFPNQDENKNTDD